MPRFDHAPDPPLRANALNQTTQPLDVRRRGQPRDDLAVIADQAHIQAPATEIQIQRAT